MCSTLLPFSKLDVEKIFLFASSGPIVMPISPLLAYIEEMDSDSDHHQPRHCHQANSQSLILCIEHDRLHDEETHTQVEAEEGERS